MNSIFKKENVYVAIKGKNFRDGINLEDLDSLIFSPQYKYKKNEVSLYGGRVYLHYYNDDLTFAIDGIPIREIHNYKNGLFASSSMEVDKATAFLNQIENLGVDSFLENYKSQLQEFKIL